MYILPSNQEREILFVATRTCIWLKLDVYSMFTRFATQQRGTSGLINHQLKYFAKANSAFTIFSEGIADLQFTNLRACPWKNLPLKFSWKMDCLHFFYTSQATYAMNENGLYFGRFAFLIFGGTFFVGTPKTTQTGN